MTNIKPLPTPAPDWQLIADRSAELGAVLLAVHTAQHAHDERDRLPSTSLAALNALALRLHGEYDEMVRRCRQAGHKSI